MNPQSGTYAVRGGSLEQISAAIGSLLGVELKFVESEVWDDYYSTEYTEDPLFCIKKNDNPLEDEIDFYHPEFADYPFFLEVVRHPNFAEVHRLLTESSEIDAVLIPDEDDES